MERKEIERHLISVERQVLEGQEYVAKQRALIAELEEVGRDTSHARRMLMAMLELLRLSEADRERLHNELERYK